MTSSAVTSAVSSTNESRRLSITLRSTATLSSGRLAERRAASPPGSDGTVREPDQPLGSAPHLACREQPRSRATGGDASLTLAHAVDDVEAVIEGVGLVSQAPALGLADTNDLHLAVVVAKPGIDLIDQRGDLAARAEVLDLIEHGDILPWLYARIDGSRRRGFPAWPA